MLYSFSSLSYITMDIHLLFFSHWGVGVHILFRQRSVYFIQLFNVVLPGCCLFSHVIEKLSLVFSSNHFYLFVVVAVVVDFLAFGDSRRTTP